MLESRFAMIVWGGRLHVLTLVLGMAAGEIRLLFHARRIVIAASRLSPRAPNVPRRVRRQLQIDGNLKH